MSTFFQVDIIYTFLPDIAAQRLALAATGENQLAKREIAIVQNQLEKRTQSRSSAARRVGQL
ncbi:MAG: hypothetical protein BroJett021_37840 [Chloroflexota bacterium]|nr:MAG: hypothetical protein BroJett021_37840 [Chloroflexota bacterium]